MENFFTKMEVYIVECGNKIKWMGKVFYIIAMANLHTMVNGKQINLTDLEFFIIRLLSNLKNLLIIWILIILVVIGIDIRVTL